MLLVVDVGNTQTEIGLYGCADGREGYHATWRTSTEKHQVADDLVARLYPLFKVSDMPLDCVGRVAIASVVPSLEISWQHLAKKLWGVDAIICSAGCAHDAGLFDADYPNPSEIGSDRVADAIAARSLYGSPCVVVDFGTATNIEVIDKDGRFVGGVIAPGIVTGANALFSNATQIAAIGISAPESVIGKSTTQAVQSGLIFGEVGRADGLLERIFAEIGGPCPVVATGGLCHTVSRLSRHITDVRPELTLDGLRILAENLG